MADEKQTFTVAGYKFATKEEAQDAKDELNAIKYLSSKTDGQDPKQVYMLYNQILDKQLFNTPVGIDYLKELQQFLYINKDIPNDKIRPIPINNELSEMLGEKKIPLKVKDEIRQLKRDKNRYKDKYIKLMIVNIVLVVVIAAMAVILKTSSTPTVIDYERKLQDNYATWQEQLESQEASLKARENQTQSKQN